MCRGAPCVKAHDSQTGEHPGSSPWTSVVDWLLGFNDFAAAQAGRADAHALGGGADFGVHGAQVNVPAPAAYVVRVADLVTKLRAFAADVANLCHLNDSRDTDSEEARSFQSAWLKINFTGR